MTSRLLTLILCCFFASCSPYKKAPLSLTQLPIKEKQSIGMRIWKNEGNQEVEYLTFWSDKEPFPSMGIGHFTWHPKGLRTAFKQSFPTLIQYMIKKKTPMPSWLKTQYHACPWSSRKAFYKDFHSAKMKSLRRFLQATISQQTDFIILRTHRFLPRVKKTVSLQDYRRIQYRYQLLATSSGGIFALIDYVNFKGEGLKTKEAYQNQGWGLKQVLLEMQLDSRKDPLQAFVTSADKVLTRRVKNAPNPSLEKKWLRGWRNRLNSYLKIR